MFENANCHQPERSGSCRSHLAGSKNGNVLGIAITSAIISLAGFIAPPVVQAETFEESIAMHLERYPSMQADDLYKLVYQGCMGPGHLGVDRADFLNYLEHEISQLDDRSGSDTVLVEKLPANNTAGCSFVRVYLRPCLESGGTADALADAFTRSLQTEPDTTGFFILMNRLAEGKVDLEGSEIHLNDLLRLRVLAQESNLPPIHHSERYKALYDPHYRVLSTEAAQEVLKFIGVTNDASIGE